MHRSSHSSAAHETYWAPSAHEGDALSCPSSTPMPVLSRAKPLQKQQDAGLLCPGVDDRLVVPETTRDEMLRGEKILALPANPPHAEQHTRLDYVVFGYTRPGYRGATDMLTRMAEGSDFATDTSIRKDGIDPKTGRRYLEELSFEIVDTQSDAHIQARAEDLTRRGVRRVFAIFVNTQQVCEWSTKNKRFVPFGRNDVIDDPIFVAPLLVKALLDAAEADNEVARALIAKNNPVLEEKHRRDLEEGERNLLLRQLEARFGALSPALLERVRAAGSEQLMHWGERVLFAASVEDVFL